MRHRGRALRASARPRDHWRRNLVCSSDALGTVANPGAFRTWLFQTTRHRALDFLRRRRRETRLMEGTAPRLGRDLPGGVRVFLRLLTVYGGRMDRSRLELTRRAAVIGPPNATSPAVTFARESAPSVFLEDPEPPR